MTCLQIENLNFSYANLPLFENINIAIDVKNIICITGNNGSGKSTFLRLIHGIIKAESGTIRWIHKQNPKIGMVFQNPLMLRRSVIANIKFVLNLNNDKTNPLVYLQQLDLSHLAHKPARSLSGGEQQKLAIARILALNPDVILLDEPTAHLDAKTSEKIENLILNLSEQGKKIFLVSHDMEQVKRLATTILHLNYGHIIHV